MDNQRLDSKLEDKSMVKMFQFFDHLGRFDPYVLPDGELQSRFNAAIFKLPHGKRKIDPVGVIEFLSKGYLMAERTMVQGLRKAPWMGRPDGEGGWLYAKLPAHGRRNASVETVAGELKQALREEALGYIQDCRRVALLLSGGLDSRIVAGILREIQLAGDYTGDVVAVTWGLDGCRDVSYAAEIAKRYQWDWIHLTNGPERLRESILLGGEMGAEFAPYHLHAMAEVSSLQGVDVVLAGSYGDSIGRAEFSGRRVLQLKPTLVKHLNRLGLIHSSVVMDCADEVYHDAYGYRAHVHRNEEWQYREIEQQMHYMRRRNQSPMAAIAFRIPLHQMFTAPKTFGLMWGIDVSQRDDRYYEALLPTMPGGIGAIPWSRSGRVVGDARSDADSLRKMHHQYGSWLRNELNGFVSKLIDSNEIGRLGIFNENGLDWLLHVWRRAKTESVNGIDEIVAWMASLAVMVGTYRIDAIESRPLPSWPDRWAAWRGQVLASMTLAVRNRIRP